VTDPTAEELEMALRELNLYLEAGTLLDSELDCPTYNGFARTILAAARRELARLRAPAAGAPSEAVATLRAVLDKYRLDMVPDDAAFRAAIDTLERELAEKTARVVEMRDWQRVTAELRDTLDLATRRALSLEEDERRQRERIAELESQLAARPALELLDDWTEEDGCVLWWLFPITEPPYVGTPLDDEFPSYVTHWTRIVVPAPKPPEGRSDGE
jgi:hypothetical protein